MQHNFDWRGRRGSATAGVGSQIEGRIFNSAGAPVSAHSTNTGHLIYDTSASALSSDPSSTTNGRLIFSDGSGWRPIVTSVKVLNSTGVATSDTVSANGTVNGLAFVTTGNSYDIQLTMKLADASNSDELTSAHYNLLAGATRNNTASTLVLRDSSQSFAVGRIDGLVDLVSTDAGSRAANKNYVDSVAQGLAVHDPCKVRAQANVNVASPGSTVDGVTMSAGDRVLLDLQTTTTEDGIWIWNGAAVAMTRSTDFPTGLSAAGAFVFIQQGTDTSKGFVCSNSKPNDVVGTNNLTFSQFSGAGSFTAGNGMVLVGNVFHFATSGTYTVGDMFYASAASGNSAVSRLAAVATGNALISQGTSTAPAWGKVSLTTTVSGILPIANGGTGADLTASGAAWGFVYKGSGGTALAVTAALNGVIVSNGSSAPTAATGTQYGLPYWATTTTLGTTAAGTSTQVLHGNAAGAPTWGAVNVTTDVTGVLLVVNGGTGKSSFTTGSVIFMGETTLQEDNANFYWNDTTNLLGLKASGAAVTETLTLGGGGFRINNGSSLTFNSEMFGMWKAAYGGAWNRGIGWVGSSDTVGGIIGASGSDDVFSNFFFGPTAATSWVNITAAGQLQVTTTGSSAGVLLGNGLNTALIYCATDKVIQAQQLTVDISTAATCGFRADATNVASQCAFAFFNQAADANPIWRVRRFATVDAIMEWGAGGASAVDTNLYRSSANTLKTDDNFVIGTLGAGSTNTVVVHNSGTLQSRTINAGVWGSNALVDVSGSGTANTLPKFTGTSTVANSNISDNGTNITMAPPSNGLVILALSGTGYVSATRAASTDIFARLFVTGDSVNRFQISSGGVQSWGPGGASAVDTTLYRSAASTLRTDGNFVVGVLGGGSTNTVVTHNSGLLQSRTINAGVWSPNTLVEVSGSGTANAIPKWSASSTLSNSNISDNGTDISFTPPLNGKVIVALTGTGFVSATRAASTDVLVKTFVTGDTVNRFQIDSGGVQSWGSGGIAALDTTLYRSAASTLRTDGHLVVNMTLVANGATTLGDSSSDSTTIRGTCTLTDSGSSFALNFGADVNLYRSAANVLRTDDTFVSAVKIGAGLTTFNSTGTIESAGHVCPNLDNTYDLGEASYRWRALRAVSLYGSIYPSGFTLGSVIFAGASGVLSQDNSNFYWDSNNFTLSIAGAQTTAKTAISLASVVRSTAGAIDSHYVEFLARTYDTVAHYGAWRLRAQALTNAGSSQFMISSGLDAAAVDPAFAVARVAGSVNYLLVSGTATGAKYAQIGAEGTDAAVGIALKPKGSAYATTYPSNTHSVHQPEGRISWTDSSAAKPTCSLTRIVVVNLNGVDVDRGNTVPTIGTSIVITHNLANQNVWAFLVRVSTNAVEIADITETTSNTVTLGFANAPISGDYRAVIMG